MIRRLCPLSHVAHTTLFGNSYLEREESMCSRPNYKFWPKIIMWEQRKEEAGDKEKFPRLDFSVRGLGLTANMIWPHDESLSDGGSHDRGYSSDFTD